MFGPGAEKANPIDSTYPSPPFDLAAVQHPPISLGGLHRGSSARLIKCLHAKAGRFLLACFSLTRVPEDPCRAVCCYAAWQLALQVVRLHTLFPSHGRCNRHSCYFITVTTHCIGATYCTSSLYRIKKCAFSVPLPLTKLDLFIVQYISQFNVRHLAFPPTTGSTFFPK